jgi:hypothetical protein
MIGEENVEYVLAVNPEYIKTITNPTYEQCLVVIKKSGKFMEYIPPTHQTEELCLIAINEYPEALQFIENQTDTIAITAVIKKGAMLKYVKNKTHDICMAAIENDGMALEYVDNQNLEIIVSALKKNTRAFKFVNELTVPIAKYVVSIDPILLKEMLPQIYKNFD